MGGDEFFGFLGLQQRKHGCQLAGLCGLSSEAKSLGRWLRGDDCHEQQRAYHSAKLPSLVRQTGLRHRWRSLSAARTAASSISTPSPGPSGTGKKPSTGVSASLLRQKFSRSCPPTL